MKLGNGPLAALVMAAALASDLRGLGPPFEENPRPRDTTPKFCDRPNPNRMPKDAGRVTAAKKRKRRA
jgi:hypothetical protein